MFKCMIGNHISKPGEKRIHITLVTRPREYVKDIDRGSPTYNPHGPTQGTEIVEEIATCSAHAGSK